MNVNIEQHGHGTRAGAPQAQRQGKSNEVDSLTKRFQRKLMTQLRKDLSTKATIIFIADEKVAQKADKLKADKVLVRKDEGAKQVTVSFTEHLRGEVTIAVNHVKKGFPSARFDAAKGVVSFT